MLERLTKSYQSMDHGVGKPTPSLTAPELTYLLILMGDTERGTIIRPGAFTGQDALALREKLLLMLPVNDGEG